MLLFLACAGNTLADDVALVGLSKSRAIVVVGDGRPQTVVGQATREGFRLRSLDDVGAVFERDGRSFRVVIGERVVHQQGDQKLVVRLVADRSGHFTTEGKINAQSASMLIDTGASLVSMGRSDAARLKINYSAGQQAMSSTANGVVRVWRVKLDSVELGGLRMHNVDAAVHDSEMPFVLLGMSFLSGMDWRREGDMLLLSKRY
ncbi:MAG: TIGR02281 family clan AA aspartic protease, partial [Parazoarcus communis]